MYHEPIVLSKFDKTNEFDRKIFWPKNDFVRSNEIDWSIYEFGKF